MKNIRRICFIFSIFIGIILTGISYHSAQAQVQPTPRATSTSQVPPTPNKDAGKKTKTPIPVFASPTPTITITLSSTATDFPIIANPTDSSVAEDGWSGTCGNSPAAVGNDCVNKLLGSCFDSGGVAHVDFPEKDGGTATVTCTLPNVLAPTELPISAGPTSTPGPNRPQDEGYLGQCTKADGDFFKCAEQFTCPDGLLVVEVDLYSGNGTTYDFYCIKDEDKPIFPPGGWLPWITGLGGLGLGLFIRSGKKRAFNSSAESAGKEDDDDGMQLRSKRAEIPNDSNDEGFHRLLGDAEGDTPPPPPPPKK